jgi:hypothetical protein
MFVLGLAVINPNAAAEPIEAAAVSPISRIPDLPELGDVEAAQRLNILGHEAYQAGRLVEAAALWHSALTIDPSHAIAHYNLACALSLLMPAAPGGEDYLASIVYHLKQSVVLRPDRIRRIGEDPDLNRVRDREEIRLIMIGPNPDSESVLSAAIMWRRVDEDRFTPSDQLEFDSNHHVRFRHDIEGLRGAADNPDLPDQSFTGHWAADGKQLVILTDAGRTITGIVSLSFDEHGFVSERSVYLNGIGTYGCGDTSY